MKPFIGSTVYREMFTEYSTESIFTTQFNWNSFGNSFELQPFISLGRVPPHSLILFVDLTMNLRSNIYLLKIICQKSHPTLTNRKWTIPDFVIHSMWCRIQKWFPLFAFDRICWTEIRHKTIHHPQCTCAPTIYCLHLPVFVWGKRTTKLFVKPCPLSNQYKHHPYECQNFNSTQCFYSNQSCSD